MCFLRSNLPAAQCSAEQRARLAARSALGKAASGFTFSCFAHRNRPSGDRANTRTSRRNPFILHTLLPPAQAVGGQFTPARISADSLNRPPSCLHHGPQRDKERKSTVAALRFPPGRSALTGLLFECSTSNRYLALREASLSIGRAATPHCMSGPLYSLCFAARCRVQKETG